MTSRPTIANVHDLAAAYDKAQSAHRSLVGAKFRADSALEELRSYEAEFEAAIAEMRRLEAIVGSEPVKVVP